MSDDGRNRAVMGGKVFRQDLSVYEEWILNEGLYLLRLTNNANGAITAVINAFWYE